MVHRAQIAVDMQNEAADGADAADGVERVGQEGARDPVRHPFLTNAFNAIGGVNPIAAFCMSTAICARWTMVGHHVCHGGYNTAQSEGGVVTGRFHRRTFAKGLARRITDWMDRMMPEAWDVEHNHLHHYQVRLAIDEHAAPPIARTDRDVWPTASPAARPGRQRRAARILFRFFRARFGDASVTGALLFENRDGSNATLTTRPPSRTPFAARRVRGPRPRGAQHDAPAHGRAPHARALRALGVVGSRSSVTWFYYAPNTMKEMYGRREREAKKNGEDFENPFQTGELPSTVATVAAGAFKGKFGALVETIKCFAPYATFQFAVLPALGYAVGGASMAGAVLATSILADVMTNVHSFIIIATNHVGDDIYRFESETKPRSDDFYLRAVIGSANFRTGGDVNDFFHGWLNYQIEHHMFPDISMKQYQLAQPKIKAICEKHGVPYVQESVWKRVVQLADVMVGKRSMLVWERGD